MARKAVNTQKLEQRIDASEQRVEALEKRLTYTWAGLAILAGMTIYSLIF